MGEAQKSSTMKKNSDNRQKAPGFGQRGWNEWQTGPTHLDRSLDRMLKAAADINRELDELLAKARS
jgi:hypothetical protein